MPKVAVRGLAPPSARVDVVMVGSVVVVWQLPRSSQVSITMLVVVDDEPDGGVVVEDEVVGTDEVVVVEVVDVVDEVVVVEVVVLEGMHGPK
jgi:hypothetical protein